jgi:hypothetical protein
MTPRLHTLETFWASLRACGDYSIKFGKGRPGFHISLVDEVSRVGDHLFEYRGQDGTTWLQEIINHENDLLLWNASKINHWTCTEVMRPGQELRTTCFLSYAFLYPFRTYVDYKLRNGASPDIRIAGHSLLYTASYALNAPCRAAVKRGDRSQFLRKQSGWTDNLGVCSVENQKW